MAIAKIAMRIEELAKQISEICGQQERPSETFFDMEIAHTQAVDLYFAASLMADLAQNIINYSYLLSLVPDGHPDSLSDEDAFHLLPSHPPWAF